MADCVPGLFTDCYQTRFGSSFPTEDFLKGVGGHGNPSILTGLSSRENHEKTKKQ
jgi:hypothetical protein